jgi:hypothetical protein
MSSEIDLIRSAIAGAAPGPPQVGQMSESRSTAHAGDPDGEKEREDAYGKQECAAVDGLGLIIGWSVIERKVGFLNEIP